MLKLPIKVGTIRQTSQVMIDYVIIDIAFAYNIIVRIRLPTSLRATLSTYNLGMQYLVDNGTMKRIIGDQKTIRDCYITTLKVTISHLEYKVGEALRNNKGPA